MARGFLQGGVVDALLQDLRTALRGMRATPWFTLAVVATLTLAIGANTLIFSVVDSVLLNPLRFRSPDGLVAITALKPRPNAVAPNAVSPPDFVDWKAQVHRLGALASFAVGTVNMTGVAEPVRLKSAAVSANWFSLLGIAVARGRAFVPDDDRAPPTKVVILSDAFWRSRFNADTTVIGRTVDMDGLPQTIIGIAPPEMKYPDDPDIWLPSPWRPELLQESARSWHYLRVIGRIAPGTTFAGAQEEFETVTERLRQQHMDADAQFQYRLTPLRDSLVGASRNALLVLFGAVGCVLLIACANAANLLLVRASGRTSEMGVRIALGASPERIVRALLTESVLLSLLGAAGGIMVASFGIRFLVAAHPGNLPRLDEVTLSLRVLAFTIVVATVTGLLFGLAPALYGASADVTRGMTVQRRSSRWRSGLVIAETAVAVLLLIGAGLLTRTFASLMTIDPGFVPEHVVRFDTFLPDASYILWTKQRAFADNVVRDLQNLPGTVNAGAAYGVPFSLEGQRSLFHIVGRPDDRAHRQGVYIQIATPGYFATMGIPVKKGRTFAETDRPGGHQVLIVNEALANQYFPGEDPVGKRLTVEMASDTDGHNDTVSLRGEIVGVVGDTRVKDLTVRSGPALYAPEDQFPSNYLTFVVRTRSDPATVLRAARQAVAAVDPTVPIFATGLLADDLRKSLAAPRLSASVVAAFAIVALALAVIGMYGVLAYTVRERRRELGIRIALGAREGQVVGMVVGQGLRLAAAGLCLGLGLALLGGHVLASLLYGVSPNDPPTFEAVSVGLMLVAVLASWLPARRAAVVDPVIAMRPE